MRETPVTVVGTLVSDVRLRRVGPDERLVLNFRIASNERRYDKASESWVNGASLYLSVSCWRTLAENAACLVKGDPVIVSGRLRTREWTTTEGARRSVIEMEASAVGPDLARCAATVRKLRRVEEPVGAGTVTALSEFRMSGEFDPPDEEDLTEEDLTEEDLTEEDLAEEDLTDEEDFADEEDLTDEEDLADGESLADGVRLAELAEAARPLVPVSA